MNRLPGDVDPVVPDEVEPGFTEVDTAPRIGFALSGGGSRGAFGVGALAYLTNVMQLGASVVTGTSVGALSALKLAAFPPASQGVATTQLLDQWTALMNDHDMWVWEPWVEATLSQPAYGTHWRELLEGFLGVRRSRDLYVSPPPPAGVDALVFEIAVSMLSASTVGQAALAPFAGFGFLEGRGASVAADAFQNGRAVAFTNLGPTETLARIGANPASVKLNEESGTVQLRLATTCLEPGLLRYITGTGAVLERDNVTPVKTVTIRQEDPACAALAKELDELMRLPWLYDDPRLGPGEEPEDIAPAIRLKKKELDACRREHPPRQVTRNATIEDIVKGALASAAAPTFFPPQVFFGETYIDGGIRELTPVEVAFQCGAEYVYAISESALQLSPTGAIVPGITPRPSGETFTDLISIAARSLAEITLDEIANDDLRGYGDAVSVIAPTFNAYSGLVIDPGLIDIWIDYGLMRAADVASFPAGIDDPRVISGARAIELSDHLTRLRVAVWLAEHVIANAPIVQVAVTHGPPGFLPRWQADGPSIPLTNSNSEALHWVRFLRVLERALVARREQLGLLAGRETWGFLNNWERHPFGVPGVLWPTSATRLRAPADPPGRRLLRDVTSHRLFQFLPTGAIAELTSPASASPPGTNSEISDVPPGLIDALRTP
jgi:predicted acylesterase/phospholipase RssA